MRVCMHSVCAFVCCGGVCVGGGVACEMVVNLCAGGMDTSFLVECFDEDNDGSRYM